jgi:hypothetical protein
MPKLTSHPCKLFADDSKIIGIIKNDLDAIQLQEDLNNLVKWSTDWRMLFNPGKCKVMHFGQNKKPAETTTNAKTQQTQSKTSRKRDPWTYTMFDSSANITTPLGTTDQERDLGIIITNDLKWHIQTRTAANKANSAMGMLKRTFKAWDTNTFRTLYCSSVRSHLEYASVAWSPHSKQDIKILEDVQRRATKVVHSIRHLPYDQRLVKIGIPRLSARRPRGDAIQLYKSVNDYNHINWHHTNSRVSSLGCQGPAGSIRGQNHRLSRQFTKCSARENFFSNRVVETWNRLPTEVINSCSVNAFKNSYDRHMIDSIT